MIKLVGMHDAHKTKNNCSTLLKGFLVFFCILHICSQILLLFHYWNTTNSTVVVVVWDSENYYYGLEPARWARLLSCTTPAPQRNATAISRRRRSNLPSNQTTSPTSFYFLPLSVINGQRLIFFFNFLLPVSSLPLAKSFYSIHHEPRVVSSAWWPPSVLDQRHSPVPVPYGPGFYLFLCALVIVC